MAHLTIINREPAWPHLKPEDLEGYIANEGSIEITGLDNATSRGEPSVAMLLTLPDGRKVIAETTLVLFLSAADAMRARFGDPRTRQP